MNTIKETIYTSVPRTQSIFIYSFVNATEEAESNAYFCLLIPSSDNPKHS